MVVLEAEHTCLTMRGVKKPGVKTVTIATRGIFTDDIKRQNLFLEIIKGSSC
jgi:GTP cyclohydrolase I